MGTIALAMHREQVINYKEIYGEDDKDSEKHINDLKEKISTYYKGAEQMFDTAMKWREGFITLDDHKSGLFTKVHTYTYKDAKNPNDDQVLSSNFGESQAKEAFESLKKRTMNQYEAQLNTILMPSSSWKYFDSTQYSVPYEPEKRWKVVESGPFGLGLGGSSFDDKKLYGKHGFPTQIVVRSGSRIDSIQFNYDSEEGNHHGGNGGSPHTIELGKDKKITKVAVRLGDAVDGLSFYTDAGDKESFGACTF